MSGTEHPTDRHPTGTDEAAIEVSGLSMRYGSTTVLDGIDLTARRGEVVALLGPNGAGKSTTVEILEGFRGRSAGDVSVLGVDPGRGGEEWRARLGIVLQSWRDHGRWRVGELLEHAASLYRPFSTPAHPRPWPVTDLLSTVGLAGQVDQRIDSLSGGQRRRLDIAVGVVGRPELLFLDEPTAGFDPEARREFYALVESLVDDRTTVLLTTHDLTEAERLADRVLILVAGQIVAEGSVADLSRQTTTAVTVSWSMHGRRHEMRTEDPTTFVRELFEREGSAVRQLVVPQSDLEEIYLRVVDDAEAGRTEQATQRLQEALR